MQADPATRMLTLMSELVGKQSEEIKTLTEKLRAIEGTHTVPQTGAAFYWHSFGLSKPVLVEFEGHGYGIELLGLLINGEWISAEDMLGDEQQAALTETIRVWLESRADESLADMAVSA